MLGLAIALPQGFIDPLDAAPNPSPPAFLVPEADRGRIDSALPDRAPAQPARPRRLLIFERNVGYGGHPSIAHASLAFRRMGEKLDAYAAVTSQDPAVFERARLAQFDAVLFNNTVGNLFTNADLRQNLADFVCGGGGLMGLHGASVAFTRWPGAIEDWPEFGRMLGARGANHRDSTEPVFVKVEDMAHPLTRMFDSRGFEYRDEFFRFHEVYSRQKVRVLLSIDTGRTDLNQGAPRGNCLRADHDYALAWIRQYGRGRVFYSTIAHNPYVFWDRSMLEFYLHAIQFALGDLDASTLPSARITPAALAQDKLGWGIAFDPRTRPPASLFEAIDRTAALGLSHLVASDWLPIAPGRLGRFDARLPADDRLSIRLKLDDAGVRILAWRIDRAPADPADWPSIFQFARNLGIESLIVEPPLESLKALESLCAAHGMQLAIPIHKHASAPAFRSLEGFLETCPADMRHLGVWAGIEQWAASGIDPVRAVQRIGRRLFIVALPPSLASRSDGADALASLVRAMAAQFHRVGIRPILFALDPAWDATGPEPDPATGIRFLETLSLDLAASSTRTTP